MTLDLPLNLIEESKKIISIPSDPEHGTRELVEFLVPLCHQTGFHLFLQPGLNGDARKEINLIAYTVPMGSDDLCPGGLALVTHLDTVPAGNVDLWTETDGNPFQPMIKGDKIFGLGSADTKLDFLCKLNAIQNVGIKNIKIPVALIGTFGEERALAGVRLLQKSGVIHPQFALVSEPSEMQPVVKHKGILYLRVKSPQPPFSKGEYKDISPFSKGGRGGIFQKTFMGRAAHGSMPHLGESAIEKAVMWLFEEQKKKPGLQLISIRGGTVHNVVPESCVVEYEYDGRGECEKISFLKNFYQLLNSAKSYLKTHQNLEFDPPETTCNVGVIRTTSDQIEIEFDFRLIPETDGNILFEIFKSLSTEVIRSNAPMNTRLDSKIVQDVKQAFRDLKETPKFMVKSGNTEGAILSQMGVETIVMGPGRSVGNIHAPNEYNEISQLKKAVDFYTAFLKQFC